MRERPIIFSGPMVRAILEGRKTQTRRAVKPQFDPDAEPEEICATTPEGWQTAGHSGEWWDACEGNSENTIRCPYGKPGDRLWVREAWADLTQTHGKSRERFNTDTNLYERGTDPFIWYRADGEQPDIGGGASLSEPWRSPIHMPRWASRITLEVTGVRVERLQDVSEDDARAEGAPLGEAGDGALCHALGFLDLWEAINGPGSWDANPWVWVIEFKRITEAAA